MSTTILMMIAVDLVAIATLVFAIYFPRHNRADLVVAFIGVNIGVLGVTMMLSSVSVAEGVGIGLFGVLSIIRLRSSEISQRDIAYFFGALAIGLICGLTTTLNPYAFIAIAVLIAGIAMTDSKILFGNYFNEDIILDRAITNQEELEAELAQMLDAEILGASTTKVDLVNDTTWVQVRGRRGSTSQGRTPRTAQGAHTMNTYPEMAEANL